MSHTVCHIHYVTYVTQYAMQLIVTLRFYISGLVDVSKDRNDAGIHVGKEEGKRQRRRKMMKKLNRSEIFESVFTVR